MDNVVLYLRSANIADLAGLIEVAALALLALGNMVFLRVTAVKNRIPKS